MPAHRKITLSDHELLLELEKGRSHAAIGRAFACTGEAVRSRIRVLRENLPAPAARRAEETVAQTFDCIQELHESVATLHALKAACEALLRSEDGQGLDLGPHDYDLEVLVTRKGAPPIRRPLKEVLGDKADLAASIEGHFADPRTLLLQTIAQIRQHIELAVKLAERLHDVEHVERFQQAVLAAIESADPETAARIRGALHEQRQLRLALTPPGPRPEATP